MMLDALVIVLALVGGLAGAVLFGALRWRAETRKLRQGLESARLPLSPQRVDFQGLASLPAPVERYFRTALTEGKKMVSGVRLRHRGTFNMGEKTDRWKPFRSDQRVVTRRPGFDWDARVAMLPGLPARVHDAYVAGEGILHASLFGLASVVHQRGTAEQGRDLAEGELMRFFAEAAWYPTALLPSQGVAWQAVDARSAKATLTDGPLSVTLRFTFGNEGLIETVEAEARSRTVEGKSVPTPWQGRFWSYEERGGMRIPLQGEVAWLLPEGPKPYWRGEILKIEYEWAG